MTIDLVKELIVKLQESGHEHKNIDAKEQLILKENGQKAEFIKDIVAMANNGKPSYILIGIKDELFIPVGKLEGSFTQANLNNLISDKVDPRIIVEYETVIYNGNEIGVIKINGGDPPYFISRDVIFKKTDKKKKSVYRGMSFVRNADSTDGITRSDFDAIFKKRNVKLTPSIKKLKKIDNNYFETELELQNGGNKVAELVSLQIKFEGCELIRCPKLAHQHMVTDGNENKKSNIIIDLSSIHSHITKVVAMLQLKFTTDIGYAIATVTITGKNVTKDINYIKLESE